MNTSPVSVHFDGGIANVRLRRPAVMNALDDQMIEELIRVGEELISTATVRAVILSGEGSAFCSGLNIDLLRASSLGAHDRLPLAERSHGIANRFQRMVLVWREVPVPVFAALHGVALGGGFQIALGCDIRVASSSTRFSMLEVEWGIIPDCGGFPLLRGLVRQDVIRELAFTGRFFPAWEALGYGLLTAVVEDPLGWAQAQARTIADRNPDAIRAIKRLLNMAPSASLAEQLLAESLEQDKILGTTNQLEAVRAKLERRRPIFT